MPLIGAFIQREIRFGGGSTPILAVRTEINYCGINRGQDTHLETLTEET